MIFTSLREYNSSEKSNTTPDSNCSLKASVFASNQTKNLPPLVGTSVNAYILEISAVPDSFFQQVKNQARLLATEITKNNAMQPSDFDAYFESKACDKNQKDIPIVTKIKKQKVLKRKVPDIKEKMPEIVKEQKQGKRKKKESNPYVTGKIGWFFSGKNRAQSNHSSYSFSPAPK